MNEPTGQEPAALTYTNWRGEVAKRKIIPLSVHYGATEWHPEPQWLLKAFDVDKGAVRDFALRDFGAAPPARDHSQQDRLIERLSAMLAARGPWPAPPDGARVSPPSYEMHPFSVSFVFGAGWGLFRHLSVAGVSTRVSSHDSASDAVAAMVRAYREGGHDAG